MRPLRRVVPGSRATDSNPLLVSRAVTKAAIGAGVAVILGWVGFALVVIQCVLKAPHP